MNYLQVVQVFSRIPPGSVCLRNQHAVACRTGDLDAHAAAVPRGARLADLNQVNRAGPLRGEYPVIYMDIPSTQVLLVEDLAHQRLSDPSTVMEELRARLEEITGASAVEVISRGRSSAVAILPAKSQRESERLKNLLRQQLDGWKVVEAQQFNLPRTL
jgi:hypothetical protein